MLLVHLFVSLYAISSCVRCSELLAFCAGAESSVKCRVLVNGFVSGQEVFTEC